MPEVTVKDILLKVDKLLDSPKKWTQQAYARNKEGNEINDGFFLIFSSPVCFCLMGAIRKCAYDLGEQDAAIYEKEIVNEIYDLISNHLHQSIPIWNDSKETSFENVKTLLKELTQ